ncbi:MBL fold metallo-hydrolase [Thalassobacillus sp. CUG 92003]|uniref:MBL fold metallo-hydrolase n=1 Tax=Thalassobacillus sp. CUG 92003 TaxID=2736641 RepID=UPI0015E6CB54|nr:MBL fold metallo-hydrolase [Thalassobacillus sp. CUG 92003]
MTFIQLNENCYYFDRSVNIGYVRSGNQGMLIDTGIDSTSVKQVVKELKARDCPLTHLFITHAHADHYGGAAYLQNQFNVYTIAPPFESAILQFPMLEPLYLFSGNDPIPELRNKFLEGKPVRIDALAYDGKMEIGNFRLDIISLPGHSYNQAAVKTENVLYAADAYFSEDQLKKHKIPYITDAYQTLQSLRTLLTVECDGAVPGHGTYESFFEKTVHQNIDYHESLLQHIYEVIDAHPEGVTHEHIVANMCDHFQVSTPALSHFLLYKTAVTGYLVGLIKQKRIVHDVEKYRWVFRIIEGEA